MPTMEYTDKELLLLIKKGDTTAFDILFNRYWEPLYLKCYSLIREPETCEDIIQDIFLNIWQNRQAVQLESPGNYLHISARNGVFKVLEKRKMETRHLNTLNTLDLLSYTENEMDFRELETQIRSSLDHLPNRCKEIFILSRFENLSNQEIAQKLQLSNRTVENQLYRAIRHLKELLPYLLFWHLGTLLN